MFQITINTKSGGLEGIYKRRSIYQVFEPNQISGYPAVYAIDSDQRAHGDCRNLVGVFEDKLISVDATFSNDKLPEYTNPCPTADRIAAAVIENLKKGGG